RKAAETRRQLSFSPDQSRLLMRGDFIFEGCTLHAALALGPAQDPVSDLDGQPLFATVHPGSGASFLGIVVALRF
ncbi:MAG: hypothetical protein WAJ95_20765, partial [Desulfobacterales bacterium]